MRAAFWIWLIAARTVAGLDLQISLIMQGSDFINVSLVPSLSVNQFDLGDVFLSPCREGSYSADHSGVCYDCSVCVVNQYLSLQCLTYQNSICTNCTECGQREIEICPCGNVTASCYIGNRICAPLAALSVNITFELAVGSQLSTLQQRFLQEAMATGFVLFLSSYFQLDTDQILLLSITPVTPLLYLVTYILNDLYLPSTQSLVASFTEGVVQLGLSNTFGQQSNTFATRRRLLAATSIPVLAQNVQASCAALSQCPQFYQLESSSGSCTSMCVALPCPAGYTGDFGLCSLCPNATFKDTTGNASCTRCPTGFTSDMGSIDVGMCEVIPTTQPAGTFLSQTSTSAGSTSTPPSPVSSSTTSQGAGPHGTSSSLPPSTSAPPTTSTRPSFFATTTASGAGTTRLPPASTTAEAGQVVTEAQITTPAPSIEVVQAGSGAVQITIINQGPEDLSDVLIVLILTVGLLALCWMGRCVFANGPAQQGYQTVPQDDEDERVIVIPHKIVIYNTTVGAR